MNIYLIKVNDYYIIDQIIKKISLENNIEDFEYRNLKDQNIKDITYELKQSNIFNTNKIVIINDYNELLKLKEEDFKYLLDFNNYNTLNKLVLLLPNNNKKTILDELEKYVFYIKQDENETEYKKIINNFINLNSFNINDEALTHIFSFTQDLSQIINYLELIILYKENNIITKEDIDLFFSRNINDNIFDLISAVINKDINKAYNIYNNLLNINISVTSIIALLLNQFQLLYDIYIFNNNRLSNDEIAKILKIKPGRVYYILKDLTKYNISSLTKNLNNLLDLDYKIKKGAINASLGFDLYLLNI